MGAIRPNTQVLLDSGDPEETKHARGRIGFLDGQTTNPTYVAHNPAIMERIAAGHKLSFREQQEEYKKIVQQISPLVGTAGVSIEVFADLDTTAEEMFEQGFAMFSWVPNAYIKYPCLPEGLRAAKMSVERGIRVNMTLCFSQAQAAAVYAATRDTLQPVYISPFVGRLDDRGQNGMELIRNIKRMYAAGDGHVKILVASLRRLDHLLYTFALGAELTTAPVKLLDEWADQGCPLPDKNYSYNAVDASGNPLRSIGYQEIDLKADWQSYDIQHQLTRKGIERFVSDYRDTLQDAA